MGNNFVDQIFNKNKSDIETNETKNNENNNKIRKIMERETAQKQIEDIRLKICGVDLEEICSEDEVKDSIEKIPEEMVRQLENAWMCGLVYFDENENCLVQKFIKPLVSNEQSCDKIHYRNELSLNHVKGNMSADQIETLISVLSLISGKSKPLIGKLKGVDVQISMACVNFFEM